MWRCGDVKMGGVFAQATWVRRQDRIPKMVDALESREDRHENWEGESDG
jgi:hypothetical protein